MAPIQSDVWRQRGYCQKQKAPPIRRTFTQTLPSLHWAIHFHIGRNWDVLPQFLNLCARLPTRCTPDLWLTYHTDQSPKSLQSARIVAETHPLRATHLRGIHWLAVPNQGADIGAYFCLLHHLIHETETEPEYLTILKLHSKKSSVEWFEVMVGDLMPSPAWIEWFLDCFSIRDDMGMIVPVCDNTDYINFTYELDLLVRSGIIPKPVYQHHLPSQTNIEQDYATDAGAVKVDFPPPPNQFRKNGLLLDTHLAWHLQRNPLGFNNEGHRTYLEIQIHPYMTNMLQQMYMISGTMFWMRFSVCRDLLTRFPLQSTLADFEYAIVKDNLWNKITHAWERFFGAYVSLQGYSILDVKYKVYFRRLPQQLVFQNFFPLHGNESKPLHQRPWMLPNAKVFPTLSAQDAPWFPPPTQPISRGFASGSSLWAPLLMARPPHALPGTPNPEELTVGAWIEKSRLNASLPRKTTWKHLWFNTADEIEDYLRTQVATQQPLTLWASPQTVQSVVAFWESYGVYQKFPRLSLEILDEPKTSTLILDMIYQIGETLPPEWHLELNGFPFSFPSSFSPSITLADARQVIQSLLQPMRYWGKSLFPQWTTESIQSIHSQYNQITHHFRTKEKYKVAVECIAPLGRTHNMKPYVGEFLAMIPATLKDLGVDVSSLQLTQQLTLFGHTFQYPGQYTPLPEINWFQSLDECGIPIQERIIQHYPFHVVLEKLMAFQTHRNRNWNVLCHPSWKQFNRQAFSHGLKQNSTTNVLIGPHNHFGWHIQHYILPAQINEPFLNLVGLSLTDLTEQTVTQMRAEYPRVVFQRITATPNENLSEWLVLSCYQPDESLNLWIEIISKHLWETTLSFQGWSWVSPA